jgi:hypothetical protein
VPGIKLIRDQIALARMKRLERLVREGKITVNQARAKLGIPRLEDRL